MPCRNVQRGNQEAIAAQAALAELARKNFDGFVERVIVEIINTGNELMLGRVLNTHQQWLCRQLADRGYVVSRQVAVPDSAPDIELAVREALSRADLVITTGGLGPTSDDLTRDAIARMLGKSLKENAELVSHIQKFFSGRNRPAPQSTRVQALVPEGALVLSNPHGTAPGLAIEVRPNPFRADAQAGWLVMLPGPARELKPMFTDSVAPLIARVFPSEDIFVCRTLRTAGVGESVLQEKIEGALRPLLEAGVELGYGAKPGQVDLRLTMRGAKAEERVGEAEAILRSRLGAHIFGTDDETLEAVVVGLLTARKETVALAESCTGGCIAHRLTNVPGASAVLHGSWVTYSNEMKQKALGVSGAAIEQHGAVSEIVAREMAEGARRAGSSDYAIAVTGIAGPGGGTPDKPVGTVFIAVASAKETEVIRMFNPWDRPTFKEVTTQQALNQMRLRLQSK